MRTVNRIGDIYCVKLDNGNKRYFQYVAKDTTQLNSSVIRIFEKEYEQNHFFNPDEIVDDNVEFYAHTFLRGVPQCYWEKVGTSKNIGNVQDIMFRCYPDVNYMDKEKSLDWYVWKINKSIIKIGELTEEYRNTADFGCVFAPINIVTRLHTGRFPHKILN